jgi:hypothetical protein
LFFLWVVFTRVLICLVLLMDGFPSLIFIYRVVLHLIWDAKLPGHQLAKLTSQPNCFTYLDLLQKSGWWPVWLAFMAAGWASGRRGKVCTRTFATFSRDFGQNHDMTLHSKPRFQPSSNSSGLTAQGPPDWFVPCRTDTGRNLATLCSSTKNNSSSRLPTKWVPFPFPVFFHIQLWWQKNLWHFNLQGKLNSSAAQSFLKWVFVPNGFLVAENPWGPDDR